MKRDAICFILIFVLNFFLYAETYNLDYCIQTAIKNNPSLKKYGHKIRQSEYSIKETLTAYYPTIRLSGNYGHSYYPDTGKADDNYSFSLGVDQLLFGGMKRWYNYRIGLLQKDISEEGYYDSFRDLIYRLKENYYKILLYKKQIEVLKKTIQRRKTDLILIKLKYDSGKEKLASVMEMESSVKESEYNEEQKNEELKLAKMRILFQMGQEYDEEFDVAEEEDLFQEFEYKSLRDKVITQSPQMNMAKAELKIDEYNLKLETADYLPKIDLSGSYIRRDDELSGIFSSDPDTRYWNFGVGISIPIFTGFSTYYGRNRIKHRIKSKQEEIKEIEDNLSSTIFDLVSQYNLLKKEKEIVLLKYNSAYENYKIINLEYKQGKTSYNWLQQKENELSRLELEKERNIYNLRVIQARIKQYLEEKKIEKDY